MSSSACNSAARGLEEGGGESNWLEMAIGLWEENMEIWKSNVATVTIDLEF